MLSDDEPRGFEKFVQSRPLPLTSTETLFKILGEASKQFDDNPQIRLQFFEEIRKTAFAFHMAYVEKGVRAAFDRNPSRESLLTLTSSYANHVRRIAELYGYL